MLAQPSELARVREENAYLKEKVAYLESLVRPEQVIKLPGRTQFTGSENKVAMRLLLSTPGVCVTKEQLYRTLYLYDDDVEMKIIDVFICKVRKKLTPHGITIETIWGRGWAIDAANHAALKALIASQPSDHPPLPQ